MKGEWQEQEISSKIVTYPRNRTMILSPASSRSRNKVRSIRTCLTQYNKKIKLICKRLSLFDKDNKKVLTKAELYLLYFCYQNIKCIMYSSYQMMWLPSKAAKAEAVLEFPDLLLPKLIRLKRIRKKQPSGTILGKGEIINDKDSRPYLFLV